MPAIRIRAGVAIAALSMAAAPVMLTGCGATQSAGTVASVTVPQTTPATVARTPGQVVRVFLAAAIARDLPTVRSLTTARELAMLSAAPDGELTNWLAVEDLRVQTARRDPSLEPNRRYSDVRYVPVHVTLRQRERITFAGGPTTWGDIVVRNGPSEAWRIDAEGVG